MNGDVTSERESGLYVLGVEDFTLLGPRGKVWERIDLESFRENLRAFVLDLNSVLPETDLRSGEFELEGFEASLTVGAKGEVGFLGTGAEASGEATLVLKFARRTLG